MAPAGLMMEVALPQHLEASEPPEARGLRRDEVRLLVSDIARDSIEHATFLDLGRWLAPGDLLVVNTSGTLKAAVEARSEDDERSELHFSTRLPGGFWTIEVRRPGAVASLPDARAHTGATFHLPDGGQATLLSPYPLIDSLKSPSRLWIAALQLPQPVPEYLDTHGFPIRYSYVRQPWPISMYQTVFATEPGSAEMPSAGRPFTPELVTTLVAHGVQIAPLLLHTGVASLEHHEPPYEEFYRVPRTTAERVNSARRNGRRVIAVGTTVVRALETVTDESGMTSPGEGWTNIVIGPERGSTNAHHALSAVEGRPVRSVTGLITGLHEPKATHLMMLEQVVETAARTRSGNAQVSASFCGPCHLERAYAEARQAGYLWHEFGDSHLILGRAQGFGPGAWGLGC